MVAALAAGQKALPLIFVDRQSRRSSTAASSPSELADQKWVADPASGALCLAGAVPGFAGFIGLAGAASGGRLLVRHPSYREPGGDKVVFTLNFPEPLWEPSLEGSMFGQATVIT